MPMPDFLERRIEQAGHRLLHLVGDVVDDRVQADVDAARASAISSAFRSGRTLKPMMIAFDAEASSTSDSLIAPTPAWMMRILTFSSVSLVQRVGQHFGRALHVGLDDDRQFFHAAFGDLRLQRLEREAARPWRRARGSWPALRGTPRSAAPWRRRPPGRRRPAAADPSSPSTSTGVDGPAVLVGRPRSSISARTRPTIGPAMKVSPTLQRAVLDEHGGDRPAAFVELGFEHRARRAAASGWP